MKHRSLKRTAWRAWLRANLRSWLPEFFGLMLASFVLHFLVLRYIYPKYYDPFWPHHSDFYLGPSLSRSDNSIWTHLAGPRPLGFLYLEVSGFLGIRGAIAANLILVLLNGTLIAMLIRRIGGINLNWVFACCFIVFEYFVYSSPQHYIWSTYDILTQLSLVFFLLSVVAVRQSQTLWAPTMLWVCALLTKETYALAALMAIGVATAAARSRRYCQLFVLFVVVAGVAVAINLLNQSIFLGSTAGRDSPYAVDPSPFSVTMELVRYARESATPAVWLCLACVATTLLHFWPKHRALVLVLPAAAALSWFPNALIPNHHAAGYALNGALFLFSFFLLLCAIPNTWVRRASFFGISIFALMVPRLSKPLYEQNAWIIEQQKRQRNFLKSLIPLAQGLAQQQERRSVIVSGLNFPFSPFDHGHSLLSIAFLRDKQFSVIVYDDRRSAIHSCVTLMALTALGQGSALVRFVAPTVVQCMEFDEVWMFRNDGTHIAVDTSNHTMEIGTVRFDVKELMIAPGMFDILSDRSVEVGTRLLNCGASFLSYNQASLALRCLAPAIERLSDNPYAYFYYGLALEQTGHYDAAARNFRAAIDRDQEIPRNGAFADALSRVTGVR